MIRLRDAVILAYTKLRTHKVRTGISVGVSGILFGLMLAMVFVVQGALDSARQFSSEGLSGRTILAVSHYDDSRLDVFGLFEDQRFIADVEKAHKAIIAKKTAAAKKYDVAYDPATEDRSPITTDPQTKKRIVSPESAESPIVQQVVEVWRAKSQGSFDINEYLRPYSSARVIPGNATLQPSGGAITFMAGSKEASTGQPAKDIPNFSSLLDMQLSNPSLGILNGSLTKPFVSSSAFDGAKGEIPVVIPFSHAERLLGLKTLPKTASTKERYERLSEVRRRVGEVSASFCYRNHASAQLYETALAQQEQLKQDPATELPLLYRLPAATSCGPVTIAKDVRSAAEKQQAANQTAYEREIGTYIGTPTQYKMTVRAVGVVGDANFEGISTVGQMIIGLFGSNLGHSGNWSIPADLLSTVPAAYRPAALFPSETERTMSNGFGNDYFVEFGNVEEARAVLRQTEAAAMSGNGGISATPFGSSALVLDDFQRQFQQVFFWMLVIIGGVAVVILASIIGRTVAEGRRESAVFRAIGAKRSDIGAIYGVYAALLSLRVVIFALVLGLGIALLIDALYGADATLGAQLAYSSLDDSLRFRLIGLWSAYVPTILAAIIVAGLLASILPISRGARRNPIGDMRDE